MSARDLVRIALEELTTDGLDPGVHFFVEYFSASAVARRAGVSVATARRHLDDLCQCRGYTRRRIGTTYGYRHRP